MRNSLLLASLLAPLVLAACGDNGSGPPNNNTTPDAAPDVGEQPVGDILDELKAIPGMSNVTEGTTMLMGYRFFTMTYDQPLDHHVPGSPKFQQRLTFLFKDYAAPTVVYNSGYFVSTQGFPAGITNLVGGNQLSMEYRFFEPSRPSPADWTKLDIWQAASDQHDITQALKKRLFKGTWLTTGASKGGMTSLFHRRFYPGDADGTVAYVAPFDYPGDEVQSPTNRYIYFIDHVGTDATCRQNLKNFQNLVLSKRDAMKTMMAAKTTTDVLGADKALEFAVEELPFIFWQYGSAANCSKIPAANATDDAIFKFFDDTIDVTSYGDDQLNGYLPYYHQSATQLGYPIDDESYLTGLLYPGADTARAYIPTGIETPAYDQGAAMQDVQDWIKSSGSQILLVYGQNDPWSAGAVDIGNATDSFKFIAPNGNHGSSIGKLAQADKDVATNAVMRWAGIAAKGHFDIDPNVRTAEQVELERHPRL